MHAIFRMTSRVNPAYLNAYGDSRLVKFMDFFVGSR